MSAHSERSGDQDNLVICTTLLFHRDESGPRRWKKPPGSSLRSTTPGWEMTSTPTRGCAKRSLSSPARSSATRSLGESGFFSFIVSNSQADSNLRNIYKACLRPSSRCCVDNAVQQCSTNCGDIFFVLNLEVTRVLTPGSSFGCSQQIRHLTLAHSCTTGSDRQYS